METVERARGGGLLLTRRAFLGVALGSSGLAGSLFAHEQAGEAIYTRLAREHGAGEVRQDGRRAGGDGTAWLTVEGTPIDYPVALPGPDTPQGYYLDHDIDGTPRAAGCPYLDERCELDGTHLIVYGHRIGDSDTMFSGLWDRYRQESFDELGDALLESPVAGSVRFTPLLAVRVPGSFAPIQRFSFEDAEDLGFWLESMALMASAVSEQADALIERAVRVLTLVTCSEGNGHSGTRTLVLFVHGDADAPRSQEAAGYSAASAATSGGVDPKV
ncbi:class B sortase [Enorma burkinafasonensis]|uniref:class B sortase n=1 Tax=Enorma burkinafasonensis TaxID=2590867 RepID=UPI0011A25555|nr:class B sortase [Enorma burkinafasonensis]